MRVRSDLVGSEEQLVVETVEEEMLFGEVHVSGEEFDEELTGNGET